MDLKGPQQDAGEAKARDIDRALFRRVMGSFATGVTVITTDARGEVRGMTANAFMSGSLDPPLCVVSVRKGARLHPCLLEAGHFGVSVLAKDQEKLSSHFSGGPVADLEPKFVRVGRTPLLTNAVATIAANIVAHHDCGDHTLFIGGIVHLEAFPRVPLVVHEGRYASLSYSQERTPEWVGDFW
jgi:flavin reductase (DIM6/NTAB) family NADH-FMN oxidoreductase RutF